MTYTAVGGRRIRRVTLEGKEGGSLPIHIRWFDADDGRLLGEYERRTGLHRESGWMFGGARGNPSFPAPPRPSGRAV